MSDLLTDSVPFAVTGELPRGGVTVLEASAGTGKTFTIAALAARYVAEGIPLDRVLLVTFTRMATGELRERVRERLVSAEQGLSRVLAGADVDAGDEIVVLLADGPEAAVRERRDRLAAALADFDAATIATTHGFCQEVLGSLGIAGDLEPDTTLVEEVHDLVDEVVDDLYVRRFHRGGALDLSRDEALAIARAAIANPTAPLEPRDAPPNSIAAMRVRLAGAARDELDRRKRRAGLMTYDDLLTRLRAVLAADGSGAAAARRLQQRYRVVLVDEFQDTDPVQWEIMRRAFGGGDVTLVLIGDPKQAIYAFRGADVYAYLEAARAADARATLNRNWRTDQGLLDAYDAMFGGARLGHEGIVYRQVIAADVNAETRLHGAPDPAPLRMRVVHRDERTITRTRAGYASNASVREHVAKDLAADLVRLLESGAEIDTRAGRRAVCPGDVAVLVRTHRNAALVRDALEAVGVPAVINGAGSVFGTDAARDWLRLLEAIERPSATARARAAALTPFLGWTTEEVAAADEDAWEELHRRLHQWARVLRERGVASLTETITLAEGLPGRVLGTADGERRLTDLRHVGQLLHAAATTEHLGTAALTSWLRQRIAAAQAETSDEERSRRLDSDQEAVQVLTIHRSKGLEFPIVYFPYLWEPGYIPRGPQPVFFHDPEGGDERTVDVGLDGPEFPKHQLQHQVEQRGEDLRLAYVALTRAQHQAVVWWAGSWDSRDSPLGRLLFARDEDGSVRPSGSYTPDDDKAVERLEALAADVPGCISVTPSTLGRPTIWSGTQLPAAELAAATFDRPLDRGWRRTSYSDITAAAHDLRVGSEPEEELLADEPADAAPVAPLLPPDAPNEAALRAVPSLLSAMPFGPQVGTFVHGVLEEADFAAADLDAELARCVAEVQARRAVDVGDVDRTIAGLRAALETPLGPLLDGRRLRDVARADRLDELTFELPLAGGETPIGTVTPSALAAVLRAHLPADDPLVTYADRLEDPALRATVHGYLTGSIDLVVRHRPGGGGGAAAAAERFVVVDYKTNWLAPPGEELTAWHHRPAALKGEMERAHYALQATLYVTALHRFLRWRLRGYDPETHLGGVLYLFLRGMSGPETPEVGGAPCGVFAWRPPGALVAELSDALDAGGAGR